MKKYGQKPFASVFLKNRGEGEREEKNIKDTAKLVVLHANGVHIC